MPLNMCIDYGDKPEDSWEFDATDVLKFVEPDEDAYARMIDPLQVHLYHVGCNNLLKYTQGGDKPSV